MNDNNKFKKIAFGLLLTALFTSGFAQAQKHTPQTFINYIAPYVQTANQKILKQRQQLLSYHQQFQKQHALSKQQISWLTALARQYRVKKANFKTDNTWKALLARVDIIPSSMVIAQASIESGWGNSRFAQLANNYFGQHCYKKGCGIIPSQRGTSERFEVEKFATPQTAIQSYLHNLNSFYAYEDLRQARAQIRAQNKPLNGRDLSAGLQNYSEQATYIHNVRSVINKYKLERFDVTT